MKRILETIHHQINSIPKKDRRSKITPVEFIAALLSSFNKDSPQRTLSGLRRQVINHTGKDLSRSSFWERMATQRLKRFLLHLIGLFSCGISKSLGISKKLLTSLGVSGIFLLDSSSITLPKDAAEDFPAPRNNVVPAAIKWHALFNLLSGNVAWFDLTEGTTHDRKKFPPLSVIPAKTLLIFDLGYWDYELLQELIKSGFYFLSRTKSNAKIEISEVISGVSKKFVGKNLMDCRFPAQAHHIIEVIGTFRKLNKDLFSCRVIGFWNPVERYYHWYATNLTVPAKLIYPLYRLRWQCELAFKACKSTLNLASITTANKTIIINLVLFGVLHSLISTTLGNALCSKLVLEKQISFSVQRCAIFLFHVSVDFFKFALNIKWLKVFMKKMKLLENELFDPNYRSRKSSLAMFYEGLV